MNHNTNLYHDTLRALPEYGIVIAYSVVGVLSCWLALACAYTLLLVR